MKKAVYLHAGSLAKQLAFTAVFAALCLVGTYVIVVPLPNGYFNAGDVFVLLSGWCLGPLYGSVAAAIGSALADVVCGFALYAPATFMIKGLDAMLAYFVYVLLKKCIRKEKLDFLPRAFSAVFGEILMVAGYFLFESVLYGLAGATISLLGNTLQGVCCAICGVALASALYPVPAVKRLFPQLSVGVIDQGNK